MNSSIHMDQFYTLSDWNDDSSTESDSGISSISGDSITSQLDHEDHSFVNTVSIIARDISLQSSIYSKALIDFTISGLTSNDVFISRSAAVFLWQLFRACNIPCSDSVETKEKMTLLLKINDGIVDSLEAALITDSYSSQMLYWVSGCFHYISRTPLGCEQLLKSNVGLLVSMLTCNLQAVVFYSITTLHNILLSFPCPLSGTNLTHCVDHILDRIKSSNEAVDTQIKLLAICIDCLSNLAYHNDLIKTQISKHSSATGAILFALLHNISNDKLLLLGMRLLKILSSDQDAKNSICNSSVFPRLVTVILKTKMKSDSQVWSITFWTLRNLSDVLFQGDPLTDYQEVLVQICHKFHQINRLDNDLILQCAAGILANASCDCPRNKKLLVKMKIHDVILSTLSATKDEFQKWSGETLEALYRCLHHLCSNHDKAILVVNKCLKADTKFLLNFSESVTVGNDEILLLSDVPISWSILRAWLGVTRHLCIHQSDVTNQKTPNEFLRIVNLNLSRFQRELENVILTTTTTSTPKVVESPVIQYLNQLHSSILNINSINSSQNSISF